MESHHQRGNYGEPWHLRRDCPHTHVLDSELHQTGVVVHVGNNNNGQGNPKIGQGGKGWLAYLAHITDVEIQTECIECFHVVSEFRYATQLWFSPHERIRRFVKGLRSDLQIPALQAVAGGPSQTSQHFSEFEVRGRGGHGRGRHSGGRGSQGNGGNQNSRGGRRARDTAALHGRGNRQTDCNAKTVTLAKPGTKPLVWEGDYISTPVHIISFHRAKRIVSKGCLAFLAHLRDDTSQVPLIESVSIVREFLDVFPADLLGIPPDRNIDFCIDLEPNTRPISIPPYRMTPAELRELKAQLQELLGKGFIRPSASPWDAPVLFVKKNDGRKANVVADALSRKTGSMGSLAHLQISRRPLAREVQTLANDLMRQEVLEKGGFLARVEARSSFLDKIKGRQFTDEKLSRIREMVLQGEAKEAIIDEEGVLRIKGRVSPMKGEMRFGKRGKLSPRYIGLFDVLKHVGKVAYELALPPGLSGVHPNDETVESSILSPLY
ncbi:uncharacterized protein [Solanum lycopersicum]|uniref:uncharacterized protein n=1 Tax=Solanum lycopersicum TaxID=4081 RepID=UPI003748617C